MKIRTGFVSNSSSTSFTICGVTLEKGITKEIPDDLYFSGEKLGIRFMGKTDGYEEYVGLILSGEEEHMEMTSQMRDDETKEEFRLRASKLLSEFFGKPIEATFHSGSWYNG